MRATLLSGTWAPVAVVSKVAPMAAGEPRNGSGKRTTTL